jgi:ABC-2 type transport system permease protein
MFVWPWHLGPLDWGVIATAYLGLVLWSGAAIAIGILFSSFTESQIIALFTTMFTLLLLFGLGNLAEAVKGGLGDVFAFVSFQSRYGPFARGLLDTRAVLYFVSFAAIALVIAFRNLESRKWK